MNGQKHDTRMNPNSLALTSLLVSIISLSISGFFSYQNWSSTREDIVFRSLAVGSLEIDYNVNLMQQFLVSNRSTTTISVVDGDCVTFTKFEDKRYDSRCSFVDSRSYPLTIPPGETEVVDLRVRFSPPNSVAEVLSAWQRRFPEEDAMCFFGYLWAEYGADYQGNIYAEDKKRLPSSGTHLEIDGDDSCGDSRMWGLASADEIISTFGYVRNPTVHHQSFQFTVETARGNNFVSERYFVIYGGPLGL